jgi:hypothetical protein
MITKLTMGTKEPSDLFFVIFAVFVLIVVTRRGGHDPSDKATGGI